MSVRVTRWAPSPPSAFSSKVPRSLLVTAVGRFSFWRLNLRSLETGEGQCFRNAFVAGCSGFLSEMGARWVAEEVTTTRTESTTEKHQKTESKEKRKAKKEETTTTLMMGSENGEIS